MGDEAQDRKLMAAVRRGDFEAFERVYQTYYRRLYSFFFRLCWDAQRSEDLLQETFIRLWKGAMSFDLKRPLAPWLYRVGKNLWIDQERRGGAQAPATDTVRSEPLQDTGAPQAPHDAAAATALVKRKRRKRATRASELSPDDAEADAREAPDSRAYQQEIEGAVRHALAGLDPEKRLAVVLCFYQGLKLREIADVLEIPLGTVKSRIFHAEGQLRGSLAHLMK